MVVDGALDRHSKVSQGAGGQTGTASGASADGRTEARRGRGRMNFGSVRADRDAAAWKSGASLGFPGRALQTTPTHPVPRQR